MAHFDEQLQNSKIAELHHREEEMLIRSLAQKKGLRYIDLYDISIDVEALRLVPEEVSRRAEIAVFKKAPNELSIAVRNADNPKTKEVIASLAKEGQKNPLYMVSLHSLEHAWDRYKDAKQTVAEQKGVLDVSPEKIQSAAEKTLSYLDVATQIAEVEAEKSAERISKLLEVLFGGALALNASDIHIEPEARTVRVRYRLDGVLKDVTQIEKEAHKLLVSRLKLLSGLKLNVHKEAQDGRFTFDIGSRKLEVRSSVIPGAYGESMVMRLLDPDASSFNYESLGLNARLHEVIMEELSRPNGALITTGPTGSGKTTALYAFMQMMHKPEVKIITIEDPVEYKLPGIVQTQVDDEYTFASGLRSILRQDPDVIMVGEIRDEEVAETAMNAALTGHYVFTTLHTNSAVGAFPRLIDLGVQARTIGSAVNIVLGQRLVRKLCQNCKHERHTTPEEQKLIVRVMGKPVAVDTLFEAKGCETCGHTGYAGRIGIFEAIRVDNEVEAAVIQDPREIVILKAAQPQGIPSMQQDGVMKALAGITSLEELGRIVDLYGDNLNSIPESV